jgi:hypothetical protein
MSSGDLRTLAESAESEDPIVALAAIMHLRQEADRALAVAVRRARVSGASWQLIAHTIGVSRQGVHKRFGRA